VLYVVGAGSSGSTLLEQALSQADAYATVGELYWVWKSFWPSMICECGSEFGSCPFWTSVLVEAYGAEVDAVRARVESLGQRFDEHSVVPALRGTSRLRPSSAFRDLARLVEPIYRAIVSVSGAEVVVDASKFPLWGFTAASATDLDLRVLHLARDPRVYAISEARAHPLPFPPDQWAPGRSAVRSTITWSLLHVQAERLAQRAPRHMLLLYRDFINDPMLTMHRIEELTDVAISPSPFEGKSLVVRRRGHAIGGHYTRPTHGATELVYDDDRRIANAPTAVRKAGRAAMPIWERFERKAERERVESTAVTAGAGNSPI
jgi:hypothetical protein